MLEVNAMGDACPMPVIKTMNALKTLEQGGTVETRVDNEIAVQNLLKMAREKGHAARWEQVAQGEYRVVITTAPQKSTPQQPEGTCPTQQKSRKNTVVVIASDRMGEGSEELGKTLLKGFFYALTQQETLPDTILFYNKGAQMSCEGSPALEDLRSLQEQGVELLTCGTCLNYYGLSDRLAVGEVTNMYVICEKMTHADTVVKP